jgi:hypothetical protein
MKNLRLLTYLLCLYSFYAQAGNLPVPLRFQEQTNWCWAGTSQSILQYFGNNVAQCNIVNWALSRSDCCNSPSSAACNVPLSMYGSSGNDSTQAILQHFGAITSIGQASTLSPAAIVAEMKAGRPFAIRWLWNGSTNAHLLTAKGFIGNDNNGLMYLNDPANAERITDYNNAVSDTVPNNTPDHTWTHTLSITTRTMPSTNISVNGSEGPTLTVSASTNLNVQIELFPNGNATSADWWVGYEQNGVFYYLTSTGAVTTTVTPWRQGSLTTANQSVFSGKLAAGIYNLYFAVDLTQNGILDGNVYWDMITVQVI